MNRNKEIEQTTDAILLMNGKAHAQRTVCDPGNISNSVKEITTASKTVKNTLDGRLPSLPERTWDTACRSLSSSFSCRMP